MAIYFASDVHLGLSFKDGDPAIVERRFVEWLRSIEGDCDRLFLVGDVFDFWFEWKRVIPKGFARLLGQIARMCDMGIEVNVFAGNHDMWLSDYLDKELGANVYASPMVFELQGKRVLVAHGDGLGDRPWINRALNSVFRSTLARWLFSRLIHPNVAMRFGMWWSKSSRHSRDGVSHVFSGEDEYLVRFARSSERYDYFVFGHLHTPVKFPIDNESAVVILGEWIINPVVGRMENGVIELVEVV